MSFRTSALLCAPIALLAATPSAAAVFTYTFSADGTGTRAVVSGPTGPIYEPLKGAVLSFTINVADGANVVYGYADTIPLTVSGSTTGVGFGTAPGQLTPFFAGTGKACFSNPNGLLPTVGSYTADPNCGTMTFRQGGVAGFGYNFTGNVTNLTVTAGGTLDNVGVILVSAIPEPATWALMFAGFAMTGYAMRRRRPQVVYA